MVVHSDSQIKYLPFLFESLQKQTFQDYEMIFVDNSNGSQVVKEVEMHAEKLGRPYKILKSEGNVGFSVAQNMAYKNSHSPYFLLLNPDMYLLPEALGSMVEFLDEQSETSNVSIRLMRWDFEKIQTAAKEGFTEQIDCIGIRLFRSRRAVEWLTREIWSNESESTDVRKLFAKPAIEVFGASGAFVAYRRSCIKSVLLPGDNLFDPTYHSYKEDLDLAYRLRNAGFTSYVILNAVAYHDRTGAGPRQMTDLAAIKNKKNQSYYVSFHSYKNHLRTLYKNEYWQNFLMDSPYILWYELKKLVFLLLTKPSIIFKGWMEIFKHISYTRAARKGILANRKTYWKGIRRWFLFE